MSSPAVKRHGLYVVLEGPEGVGKTTQIEMLAVRLRNEGYIVRQFREPDSQTDVTARTVRLLTQNPRYPMNTRTEVLLYNAGRSQSLEAIRNARANGVICLVDRNYLTTLAIQYYGRGDVPDYDMINTIISFAVGDMEPDITVILDAPVGTLHARAKDRGQGERFDNLGLEFLERVRNGYLVEAKNRNLPVISALDTPVVINENIWQLLHGSYKAKAVSLAEAKTESLSASISTDATFLQKKGNNYKITKAGTDFLENVVTNVNGNVYAFTDVLSPITIAAAMARLSRRADDMRVTILDEFANNTGKDEALIKRVITAYGDDSVQQLVGQHFVVESASNLLTKKLEWGRLAAYLEQSTRYIYFDQKDEQGNYRYYTPESFNAKTKKQYIKHMDSIFDKYSVMVHALTDYVRKTSNTPKKDQDGAWIAATRAQACDVVRAVLPVATKSTVGIYASGQALESLIMHLLADELPEARTTGQQLLKEARKVIPTFLERADNPERGGALTAYNANKRQAVKDLAETLLTNNYGVEATNVTMTDVWPRNELDVVADMLYEFSDMPLETIRKDVAGWSYAKKLEVFNAYIGERLNRRHKPGRALEKVHYSWDLMCDYGIFRDLQRHRIVDDLEWQYLTPRYGYEIPELIEKAGITEQFLDCFDESIELYSHLQKAGYELEAQYATLLGHKMRWKVTYNAREAFHLHELRTTPQGHPGYRKLVLEMHEQLLQVHPLLGEAMIFVNKDEDPALTRLAAERYTQYKLDKLDS